MMSFEELKKQYPHLVSETARLVCGEGWLPIVERFLREIAELPGGSVTVTDFYEKYGSLRVEYDTSGLGAEDSAVFDKAEILAESRSYRLCETCGKSGRLRDDRGWLFVACDSHSRSRDALPPDDGEFGIGGKRYQYDEDKDSLVEVNS